MWVYTTSTTTTNKRKNFKMMTNLRVGRAQTLFHLNHWPHWTFRTHHGGNGTNPHWLSYFHRGTVFLRALFVEAGLCWFCSCIWNTCEWPRTPPPLVFWCQGCLCSITLAVWCGQVDTSLNLQIGERSERKTEMKLFSGMNKILLGIWNVANKHL